MYKEPPSSLYTLRIYKYSLTKYYSMIKKTVSNFVWYEKKGNTNWYHL